MLNILLGVGISGTYITYKTGQPFVVEFSPTLLVSGVVLLIVLAVSLVVVPMNGYLLSRKWGLSLFLAYTIAMSINILVEGEQISCSLEVSI